MQPQIRTFGGVEVQDAVRSFMQKVYIWMTGGLVLTGVIAYQVAQSETMVRTIVTTRGLFLGLIIAELALVMAMSFLANRISGAVAGAMFVAYAALNGLTLSVIFLAYTSQSIAQVFFISAAMFAGMSVYGIATKRDLTAIGSFLIMGLFGIILASLVNFWLKSPAVSYAVSFLGVFIFLGLTAYDTQKLRNMALNAPEGVHASETPAVLGALVLYLDFINLFLMLLRLFGKRR